MELTKLEKKSTEKYIHNYALHYRNKNNNEKIYEIVSRNKDLTIDTLGLQNNAISIIGICDDKILIQKEFRLSVNKEIINFPCGLIDDGESVEIAARRELLEETNMEIVEILKILPPSFSAIGISDEKSSLIFAKVAGTPKANPTFVNEEIEPMLVTKEELKELMETYEFAGKSQVIAYLWANGFPI